MNAFYLIWQDPKTRRWHPVGRLDRINDVYVFGYTKGSLESRMFLPFGTLSDQRAIYVSNALFPIFANRTINERRPEYQKYAMWSGMDGEVALDPLLLMARMGGKKATDALQVYPIPAKTKTGTYKTVFFAHGISHLPPSTRSLILDLKVGDRLFPMLDIQNPHDPLAIALRTSDPASMVGYFPRYLAQDIQKLSQEPRASVYVTVKRLNQDAPPQFQLLCEATAKWPAKFVPCEGQEFETIMKYSPVKLVEDFQRGRVTASGQPLGLTRDQHNLFSPR